ncbi:MAG: ROK family protein [Prevotellaceae bacterium]|jgi:glucokinase|nr:ROK family protein [Prevotellaceae bacterium]
MKEVVLGIDIGGTSSTLGLVDSLGNILVESNMPTPASASGMSASDFAELLYGKVFELQRQVSEACQLVGVGIGAPDAKFDSGTIEFACNLPWRHEVVPFVALMQRHFPDIPIRMTNDANAAAIGELVYGGARGMKHFVTITLGTGVGSGVVVNGQLVYGSDGFAGELGHLIMTPQGRRCGCGRRGCLETYVSASGLRQTAFEVMSRRYFSEKSLLKEISFSEMTSKNIAAAAQQGDSMAQEVFEETGKMLGLGLANIVTFSSPEAIFLYGGLVKAGDLLLAPTVKSMNENMMKTFCRRSAQGQIVQEANVRLLPSELNDSNGAVLGAAALIWSESK